MNELHCKLLVLGGGPGGYIAGIRAGQLGIDTVLVEGNRLGGCCLNVGCIPSKAFIHAASEYDLIKRYSEGSVTGISTAPPTIALRKTVAWKDDIVTRLNTGVAGLLKKAGVRVIEGWGEMRDGKTCVVSGKDGETRIKAEHVILATGSVSTELPFLPFSNSEGGAGDGKIVSSSEMLSLTEVPSRLAVIGGGYIGLELGIAFRKMGAEVTIIEATDRILPLYDAGLTKPVTARMDNLKMRVMLSTRATGLDDDGNLTVEGPDGKGETIAADKVLVTVGRAPRTTGWGLDNLDLDMKGRFIRIDERCHTSMRNVWAIGDVTGEPMLAHRAMAQGEMVAEIIAGERRIWDKQVIPAVCFTDPEIVSAGISEREAKEAGIETVTAEFPYKANGRAMTMEDEAGFVRVIARADNHLILGLHAVGGEVSELSAQFALAIEMGARLEDIAGTIHAHPTRSEAVQEAAMKALGHALHI